MSRRLLLAATASALIMGAGSAARADSVAYNAPNYATGLDATSVTGFVSGEVGPDAPRRP